MAIDTEAVASAATACPLVAGLSGGALGEVATYLPGRRVTGVRVGEDGVEVHVMARWDVSLPEVGDQVRRAVAPVVEGQPVTVYIDDIETPGVAT